MDIAKKRKTEENGSTESPPPSSAVTCTALTPEDIRKILQPFTQDQLLDLLQSASLRHPDVLDAIRSVADRDSTLRKLFVRGLAAETTTETLRTVFSTFGPLDEAIVIFDKSTGKSKGYGFVTFKHVDGAVIALKDPSKKIDGRMTATQLAAAGTNAGDVSARKVFVGNVPFDISSERLLSQFLTYGEIEEGPLGFDKGSGKSKGFAFFVYKNEEGARASLVEPVKTIDGHQVICKLAVDNKKGKPGVAEAGIQHQHQHQHQQQQQQHAPMLISQYGGYGNSYGMQSSVPLAANNYGIGGGYGNSQFGGQVSGDYPGRLSANSAGIPSGGGFPDGSHYGLPNSAVPSQHQQPLPMPRPAPGGIYQGVPPPYY